MSLPKNPSSFLSSGILSRRALLFALSLVAIASLSACGNNSTASGVGCPGATGNFSNSSLPANSQWTYQLSGWFVNQGGQYSPYVTAGVFTADGNGHISSGFDDAFLSSFTGNYSISGNGTGSMTVNLPGFGTLVWALTLSSTTPGSLYVMETDAGFNSAGIAYQQDTAAFIAPPNGTFAFRTHVLAGGGTLAGSSASVGVMSVAAGAISSVDEDVLPAGGGAPSQRTLGGDVANPAFTTPDASGKGTMTFADSQGLIAAYDYFVIDANTYLLFQTDATNATLGLGRMEAQTTPGGGFTNASLNGGFVFGSRGDTAAGAASAVNSAGQFTTDAAGNILSGSYDTVRDGSPTVDLSITSTGTASTYSVAANGRVTATLNAGGTIVGHTIYLVNASRGFFLVNNDPTRVEDGTVDAQSSAAFTGSDFTGQFALGMGGFATGFPLDRNGTLTSDGTGNLGWAEVVNSGGTVSVPGCLPGTYTVAANGRVDASVSQLSNALVIYMISPGKSYILQADSQVQMFGGAALQTGSVVNPPGGF